MADKDYNVIYKKLEQLNENQTKVASKLEFLQKNIDNINNTISSLSDRVAKSDERFDKKINVEIKSLKKKVEEISSELKIVKADSISQINDVRDADSCYSGFSVSSKVAMTTGIDKDTIRAAYEDVRADGSPTEWAVFKFEGARIVCSARGSDFTEFRTHFADDERAFGYLRLQMGDEMSKRKKFMLVTWVGPNVSVINRAKMSTDKAIIKDIISNFAVELQLESQAEIDIDQFKDALNRAGGANYGTGIRE